MLLVEAQEFSDRTVIDGSLNLGDVDADSLVLGHDHRDAIAVVGDIVVDGPRHSVPFAIRTVVMISVELKARQTGRTGKAKNSSSHEHLPSQPSAEVHVESVCIQLLLFLRRQQLHEGLSSTLGGSFGFSQVNNNKHEHFEVTIGVIVEDLKSAKEAKGCLRVNHGRLIKLYIVLELRSKAVTFFSLKSEAKAVSRDPHCTNVLNSRPLKSRRTNNSILRFYGKLLVPHFYFQPSLVRREFFLELYLAVMIVYCVIMLVIN